MMRSYLACLSALVLALPASCTPTERSTGSAGAHRAAAPAGGRKIDPRRRTMLLLKSRRKRGLTEKEAKEIASFGNQVLPIVYDALFSRGDFKKRPRPRAALRILAHTGNRNAIPKIKEYLEQDGRLILRFEAFRTALEISNTPETRKYVVETVNAWITSRYGVKYEHRIEFGLLRLLHADIPDGDKTGLLKEVRISDFRFRAHIIGGLAGGADNVTVAVLKDLLAERKPAVTYLVANSIEDALASLQKEIKMYSTLDLGVTQNMSPADVERICSANRRVIRTLKKEFDVIAIYRAAANGGDRRALFQLGDHYLTGNLVKKDLRTAVGFLEKSAQKGHSRGQVKTGLCYLNGVGVRKQPRKGYEWILKAGKSGYVEACYQLGLCYRDGKGTAVDLDKAKVWLKKAADFPHDEARKALRAMKAKTER